ncbi:hypothetical protein GUJ93_ZPchr0013g36833 [Zizania palustris]|uniref:Uncharacterized protein n=1 Tax=Zizania palustris TaxID=103762 RepID=A0A8J5WX55_ZIZPA|nr:hypothetical protein GUJ93_ZPchr0013g36833 [Zizania palustris]
MARPFRSSIAYPIRPSTFAACAASPTPPVPSTALLIGNDQTYDTRLRGMSRSPAASPVRRLPHSASPYFASTTTYAASPTPPATQPSLRL